jgi:hypothetical protein
MTSTAPERLTENAAAIFITLSQLEKDSLLRHRCRFMECAFAKFLYQAV